MLKLRASYLESLASSYRKSRTDYGGVGRRLPAPKCCVKLLTRNVGHPASTSEPFLLYSSQASRYSEYPVFPAFRQSYGALQIMACCYGQCRSPLTGCGTSERVICQSLNRQVSSTTSPSTDTLHHLSHTTVHCGSHCTSLATIVLS